MNDVIIIISGKEYQYTIIARHGDYVWLVGNDEAVTNQVPATMHIHRIVRYVT